MRAGDKVADRDFHVMTKNNRNSNMDGPDVPV